MPKPQLKTPITVSFGAESFFVTQDLLQFRSQPGRTAILLEGSDLTDQSLVNLCSSPPMDFLDPATTKPCVVVVDNAHKFKPGKALKAYLEEKEDLSCILALAVYGKLPTFWARLPEKKVTLIEHPKLKTWGANEVVSWIEVTARELGLTLDSTVAKAIFHLTSGDLYRINSELRKLLLLVGGSTSVTVEHLQLVLSPGTTTTPWDVSDATFSKKPKSALNLASSLYQHAPEDPSMVILGALMSQAERLLIVRSMLDSGVESESIASRLGMHPYRFKMSQLPVQATLFTRQSLVAGMQLLCNLDANLKGGSGCQRQTNVELAILTLSS